jgi:hypothetical protein
MVKVASDSLLKIFFVSKLKIGIFTYMKIS